MSDYKRVSIWRIFSNVSSMRYSVGRPIHELVLVQWRGISIQDNGGGPKDVLQKAVRIEPALVVQMPFHAGS